jgi:hypothetical protein
LAWYVIQTETRSLLSFLAVMLVVATPGLEAAGFENPSRRRSFIAAVAIGAAVSFGITILSSYVLTEPIRFFFGLESRRDFLLREAEAYPVLEWLNAHDEVHGAVLVGLKRPYYAAKPIWFSAFSDPPIAERLTGHEGSPQELAARLKLLGASHIVFDESEYDADRRDGLYSWPDDRRKVFETVLAEHCTQVARLEARRIYRIDG